MANVGRALASSARRGVRGLHPRLLEKEEHVHSWKPVLIGTEPVGVSCSCGATRGVSGDGVASPKLRLGAIGEMVVLVYPNGQEVTAMVTEFSSHVAYSGQVELTVGLVVRAT